jgi:uncharacterized protein YcbK (DUF882 family)
MNGANGVGAGLGALLAVLVASPLGSEPPPARTGEALLVKKDDQSDRDPLPPVLRTLMNLHSGESVVLDNSGPSPEGLSRLLEDRAMQERVTFDPRLLERIRALVVQLSPGARVEIVSGYRSAKLNERLRKKGRHVASHSQHSLGHAIDFRLGRWSPKDVRKALEAPASPHGVWDGGIGQYDGATDRFIHLDVGNKRRWRGH